MRDPARIDQVLDTIRSIWKSNPDLRLMQLLGNLYHSGPEYYMEEPELVARLINNYFVGKK